MKTSRRWRQVIVSAVISQMVLLFVLLVAFVRWTDHYVGIVLQLPGRFSGLGCSLYSTPYEFKFMAMHSPTQIALVKRATVESFSGFLREWSQQVGSVAQWTNVPPVSLTSSQNARMGTYSLRLSMGSAVSLFCTVGILFIATGHWWRRSQQSVKHRSKDDPSGHTTS